jgi:hypothetical protein
VIALDTSVAVPALLPWHAAHERCHSAARNASAAVHVLAETYSVLTRMPAPHQLDARTVQQLLHRRFGSGVLVPSALLSRTLIDRLAEGGVAGGATYDGIVALTSAEHGARLMTRDGRAMATYESLGVSFEVVDS